MGWRRVEESGGEWRRGSAVMGARCLAAIGVLSATVWARPDESLTGIEGRLPP
jgi:hypothetical protein